MSEQAKRLLAQALALPAEERRELIEALVAAESSVDPAWEDAWATEIAARLARDPGGEQSVLARDAIAAARERLRPR